MLSTLRRLLFLGVALSVACVVYLARYALTPVDVARLPTDFEVPEGARLRGVAATMTKAGIGVGPIRFELLGRVLGRARDIKAGSYEVSAPASPLDLLAMLTRGDVSQADLVLLEGWNIRQVRAAMDAHPYLRHDTAGLAQTEFLTRLGLPETHPEGIFFPDTYLFSKGSSDVALLQRAYRAMQRHLSAEWAARDPASPHRSPREALIMASVIEKETGRADERVMVSAVLTNRLRIGMRLQADPTVIYGLGERFDGNLRKRDLLEDGPYNSYMRAGLPPTPIAMPGLASIHAALHPAKSDALYYVGRGDGSSQFSRSLDEHNRAVYRYQLRGGR